MHSNNSLFYNALLPLLDYTDSRAITLRARVELYQMQLKTKSARRTRRWSPGSSKEDGRAARAGRRSAFDNVGLTEPLCTLIDKVARQPTGSPTRMSPP